MDFSRSPEDNTFVVKSLNELNSFLGKPTQHSSSRSKLDFSYRQRSKDSSFNLSANLSKEELLNKSVQRKRSIDAQYATLSRDERAEIIAAKSKILKLEEEIDSLHSDEKVREIEDEKNRKINSNKIYKEQEECDIIRKNFKQVFNTKQNVINELNELQKRFDSLNQTYQDESKKWQIERHQLTTKYEEVESVSSSQFAQIKEKYTRQSTELMILQNKFDEVDMQLKLFKSRQEETNALISDYNELKQRCQQAEHTVKVLEENASRVDESYVLMQRNQSELAKYRILEKENKNLKEDNKLYRDSAENYLVLQERFDNLTARLAKSEAANVELRNLEYENQELKAKMEKWEATDVFGGDTRPRSPIELTRMISELQKSQLHMVEKQGELIANISITDSLCSTKTDECSQLQELNTELQKKNDELDDKCQKLKRRLTLVSMERDGLRRVLSSYENDEGTDMEVQYKQRVKEMEDRMMQYSKQISKLENELISSKQEASEQKSLCLQLQAYNEQLKMSSAISTMPIADVTEVNQYKEEIEILEREKEVLELHLEKKELQGDYNPFQTRVLRMVNNPLQLAHKKYLQDMENVKVENEKLRKKVLQLQQQAADEADESMNVSQLIKSSKPMEDLNKQLAAEKLKCKRLNEEFSKKAKDFVVLVYHVFGYRVKQIKEETYRVQSIYANGRDDFFIFQCGKNKDGITEAGMVETEHAREWLQSISDYLEKGDSIPALLATVTLELFSGTTEIRDLSLWQKAKQL